MKNHREHELNRRELLLRTGATALVGTLGPTAASANVQAETCVIDTHIHGALVNLPGQKAAPQEVLALYKGSQEALGKRIRDEMRKAGITLAFGMGTLDGPVGDPLGISSTLALAQHVPGLKVIGVADPRRIEASHMKAVEAQIDRHRESIVALKMYLGYLHFGPDDPNYVPYYRIAAKFDLPVIAHTGDTWSTKAKVKFAPPIENG